MKKFYFLIAFTLIGFYCYSQERSVMWVHGLNSNADFWNNEYARAQRDFNIRSYGTTFPTNEGVVTYANRIRNASQSIRSPRSIGVGHSLGGVALREVNRLDGGMFGGYIVFGSPLDGARIANNVVSVTPVNQFVTQSVSNLRRGPIVSSTRSKWQTFRDSMSALFNGGKGIASTLIRNFASRAILDITNDLTEGFQQTITNLYNPNDPSIRDLAENSVYMSGIKNFSSSAPKVFVFSEVASPSHLRLFLSTVTYDHNFTNLLISSYNGVATSYKIAADGISIGGWPFCGSSCRDSRRREIEAWNIGHNYLRSGWENSWNLLIGASILETYTVLEYVYVCNGISPLEFAPYNGDQCFDIYCEDCRWEYQTVTRERWINQSSDGLIKRASQIGQESNWGNNSIKVNLGDANHLNMGIFPNTEVIMRNSFNGHYGGFFNSQR